VLGAAKTDLDARYCVGDGAGLAAGADAPASADLATRRNDGRRCADGEDPNDLPESVITVAGELETHGLQRNVVMGAEGRLVEAIVVWGVHAF
jgi:hypothetical protein